MNMSENCDWVEIVEPKSQELMYANLRTGDCKWEAPTGVQIKKSSEGNEQWWELFDSNTCRHYYYNASLKKTVWQKPPHTDVIPLTKLQKKEMVKASVLRNSQVKSSNSETTQHQASQQDKQHHLQRNAVGRKSANIDSPCDTHSQSSRLSRKHVSIADVAKQTSADSIKLSSNLTLGTRPSEHFNSFLQSSLSSRPHQLDNCNKALLSPVMQNVLIDSGLSSLSSSSSSKNLPSSSSSKLFQAQQCMQDVSQITTVQVTPRPKPKAFPRTNPNLVTSRRRGMGDSSTVSFYQQSNNRAFRSPPLNSFPSHDCTNSPLMHLLNEDGVFNQTFVDSSLYGYHPGSQTLQMSKSYLVNHSGNIHSPIKKQPCDLSFSSSSSSASSVSSGQHSSQLDHSLKHSPRGTEHQLLPSVEPVKASSSVLQRRVLSRQKQQQHTSHRPLPQFKQQAKQQQDIQPAQPSSKEKQFNTNSNNHMTNNNTSNNHNNNNNNNNNRNEVHKSMIKKAQQQQQEEESRRSQTRRNSEPDYINLSSNHNGAEHARRHRGADDDDDVSPHDQVLSQTLQSRDHQTSSAHHRPTPLPKPSKHVNNCRTSDNDVVWQRDHNRVACTTHSSKQYASNCHTDADDGEDSHNDTLCSHNFFHRPDYINHEELIERLQIDLDCDNLLDLPEASLLHRNGFKGANSNALTNHAQAFDTQHRSLMRGLRLPEVSSSSAEQASSYVTCALTSDVDGNLTDNCSSSADRSLSMLLPFDTHTNNDIIKQVNETLLQQMDMERFITENLNAYKKGVLGRAVPVASLLSWTKIALEKPMIRTTNKQVRKEAPEVFRLMQAFMGDRKIKEGTEVTTAFEVVNKGWNLPELRDEIYIQLCRQTTRNPKESSLLLGWQMMGLCLDFLAPSSKFQSYLDTYINRTLDARDFTKGRKLHLTSKECLKRLKKACQSGGKAPTMEKVEQSKKFLQHTSSFKVTLERGMDLQKHLFPNLDVPWVLTVLSEQLLKSKLEKGIFRLQTNQREMADLEERLGDWQEPLSDTSSVILGALLKKWFRDLEEPLIPQNMYDACIKSSQDPAAALALVERLPALNRKTLLYLVSFLQKFGRPEFVEITQMDYQNLARIFAPNIMWLKGLPDKELASNIFIQIEFLVLLLEHLDPSKLEKNSL